MSHAGQTAVLDVFCDIPGSLLHPHLVLVKFLLPLLQLLDLCLEFNQLVGNLPGIATWPDTLPLDAVLGFFLDQANTFQHVGDVVNPPFLAYS